MDSSVTLPRHIGIIMDGNGRWAKRRSLPRSAGHEAGARVLERVINYCVAKGIENVTFYAFSTENWARPKDEVAAIMRLLSLYVDDTTKKVIKGELDAYKTMKLRFIGDLSVFSPDLRDRISALERLTSSDRQTGSVNIAVNYGGRADIVQAVNRFTTQNPGKPITENDISERLYTAHCPDPDLIIRTAGERRLSNFLIWQAAYAEYYQTPVFWPDFTSAELDAATAAFAARSRRFGGLTEE